MAGTQAAVSSPAATAGSAHLGVTEYRVGLEVWILKQSFRVPVFRSSMVTTVRTPMQYLQGRGERTHRGGFLRRDDNRKAV